MPAKNIYHDAVVHALIADGWTITDDPLTISFGTRDLYVDLGAERSRIGAEKGEQRIAVEIQSFLKRSPLRDLQEAVDNTRSIERSWRDPNRIGCSTSLFPAIPSRRYC